LIFKTTFGIQAELETILSVQSGETKIIATISCIPILAIIRKQTCLVDFTDIFPDRPLTEYPHNWFKRVEMTKLGVAVSITVAPVSVQH
jgi:hypothetical protein